MSKKKFRNTAQILRDKKMEKNVERYTEFLKDRVSLEKQAEELKLPELVGNKVRIKHEDYDRRIAKGEMSEKFIAWYEENKNSEFTVVDKVRDTFLAPYRLDGVELFDFFREDLELIEENIKTK